VQHLSDLVAQALPERLAATGRGELSEDVLERTREEVRTSCESGLADLLLFAREVGQFCAQDGIPLPARGSATSSLVSGRLACRTCPLDHDLDGRGSGPRC
jgi:DNA polymerase III alpha subunit